MVSLRRRGQSQPRPAYFICFCVGSENDKLSVSFENDGTEGKFIERLRARDERAFNELVRLYERRVFALVHRMLGRREEAEDISQEVFVQVFKAIHQFRGEAKLSTWIYRIAVNLCKNRAMYLARRHAGEEDELEERLEERHSMDRAKGATVGAIARPDELARGKQLEAIVGQAILAMDAEFREVLVLRDVEDMSYEEIAEIIGAPQGTVKSRLHRARAQLKEAIERALGERVA